MNGGERPIRSVCVAGAGIVGLSAALAFGRALPGVAITIVETEADPAALADRLPGTLPTVHLFHAAIGLDELDLVRDGIALHRLGTRFEHWSASGEPWLHVFGDYGLEAGGSPFHSVWQRARLAGRARPYHSYAAGAALAAAGKFVHPSDDPASPLSAFLYGLNLDPERYRQRLAAATAALPRALGMIGEVERRADGGVAALRLDGGRRIEADLFIDCTGPSAALLSRIDDRFEDWSRWLPCDRVSIGEARSDRPNPCDRVQATGNGWRGESSLVDRTLTVHAFASGFGEADETAAPIRPGRRPEPWVRNVLAIGDASLAIDPLHAASLHLAQSAILRALELLPGRDCHPLELREYNRRTGQETIRVRDFLALHYLRSGRRDSPFWQELSEREPPDSLARTLTQFERRGRLPFFAEETFDKQSWAAVLLGLGVVPANVDPVACGIDLDRAVTAMDGLAGRIAALPDRFPSYADVLARMRSASARKA